MMRIKRTIFYTCFIAGTFLPLSLFTFRQTKVNIQNAEEIVVKQKAKNNFKIKKATNLGDDEYIKEIDGSLYAITPKGSYVRLYSNPEMEWDSIVDCNREYDDMFPNARRIGDSSTVYNCHFYAWHMGKNKKTYCMDIPTSYYTDGSYIESTGEIGDRVCYFTQRGKNLHSGIIVDKLPEPVNDICGNLSQMIVESKWGNFGLYRHRGDQCPYTISGHGEATYVKYFKLHTRHEYSYKWVNYTQHRTFCPCGYTSQDGHVVPNGAFSGGKRFATCLLCNGKAERGFSQQSSINNVNYITKNKSYKLLNGVIVLSEEDMILFNEGKIEY